MEITAGRWITVSRDTGDVCPVFRKCFKAGKQIEKAELQVTVLGVYEACINGSRIGDDVLAPGWTSYDHRLQVQSYDVTALLKEENDLRVTVGRGCSAPPCPAGFKATIKSAGLNSPAA